MTIGQITLRCFEHRHTVGQVIPQVVGPLQRHRLFYLTLESTVASGRKNKHRTPEPCQKNLGGSGAGP